MSSQWWESAASAEASTAPGAYDPVTDLPDGWEAEPPAEHECDDPATCWVHQAVRAAVVAAEQARAS